MNELIKVVYENDRPLVSGRELHEFLEVNSNYTTWFDRMCEYGFVENVDFNFSNFGKVQFEGSREVSRSIVDHQLTIQMAKEIAMVQRNDKGKEARQYFLRLEEAWNTPEAIMARALQMASAQLENSKIINIQLTEELEKQKPKVIFADAVSVSDTIILIRELAKLLKGNGIDIGQNRLFEWLRQKGYLIKKKGTDYNAPTQMAMNLGLFKVEESVIPHPNGQVTVVRTTKVTGKGQQYFINKFLKAKRINRAKTYLQSLQNKTNLKEVLV